MGRYYLYVLESLTKSKKYIGITSDLKRRLARHNRGEVRSTKAYRPWRLAHSEQFATKKEARRREMELKRNGRLRRELFEKIGA